jgi:hypothetical protein
MDCRTASLLIEAYHDDELQLVDAARLLAHFEECGPCRERCEESGRLRDTLKSCRPVDRCPEELARRLAARFDAPVRRRWTVPRPVTIVFAAGCGIAIGWASMRFWPSSSRGFAFADSIRRVEGDLLCFRCAMHRGLPGTALAGTPHQPLLLTGDGRLYLVIAEGSARGRLEADGPGRHHVAVMARLDDDRGLADVVDVLPEPAALAAH